MTEVQRFDATTYRPGLIGEVIAMMARCSDHQASALTEVELALDLSAFLRRHDPKFDALWIASRNGQVVGCLAIDGWDRHHGAAEWRWFFLGHPVSDRELGLRLLDLALEFCQGAGYAGPCRRLLAARDGWDSLSISQTPHSRDEIPSALQGSDPSGREALLARA